MHAVTIARFGDPDVLESAERPDPSPGPGEVAIDVAHAGANYAEVLFRRGDVEVELPFVRGVVRFLSAVGALRQRYLAC